MKLIFLFLIIATLKWLSYQDFPKLFCFSRTLTLYINGSNTLFTYQKGYRNDITRVFAPEPIIIFNHPSLNISDAWELYSISAQIKEYTILSKPPQSWHINNNYNIQVDLPSGWPQPVLKHSRSIFSPEQFYLTSIDTLSDILYLKIDSVLVLIIKDSIIIDEKITSALFEKIDLIIVCSQSHAYAESIRQLLRPRICIVTSTPPPDCHQPSNLVFTNKQDCSIECSISGKKSIKIAKMHGVYNLTEIKHVPSFNPYCIKHPYSMREQSLKD
ncbi:MAG TPA: hypothetical protein VHO70_04255 [Chitinispirillaceae bacterium]|nr:hypothetical protein [Chitinispirillaceae bacterium]